MNREVLGWRLAAARQNAGVTQAELAARMGTTQSSVSRLEAGRATPSVESIERYARALGRPISLTFGATESQHLSRTRKRERVKKALGGFRFDPWARNPTAAEAATLVADGLNRGRRRS